MAKWLSKSRALQGLQCAKAMHLAVHRPDLVPATSPGQQAVFDQGHEVGLAARERFPGGVEVAARSPVEAVEETRAALASSASVLYEAAFVYEDTIVRVDILQRAGEAWNLVEVKSSTSVKDEHLTDVAIQAHVLDGVGTAISSASVMHLNNKCIWPNRADLFVVVDVTERIAELRRSVPGKVAALREVLRNAEPPATAIGPHCKSPYPCAFVAHCWKDVPTPSVFELPAFHVRAWDLFAQGIVRLDDSRLEPFVGTRLHQVRATLSGQRWVDAQVIWRHISSWQWPLHFLDFETINYALPRIDGTRPYQQVPFQFSCHTLENIGRPVKHAELLFDGDGDPRTTFVQGLLRAIGPTGSVVAYNAAFEAACIEDLATLFPEKAGELRSIVSRLVDPLPVFREGVYDPAFRGSFSLKSVAPAIMGERASYDGLGVGDGGAAQRAYCSMISPTAAPAEKARLRAALLAYCKQDTLVMVDLVTWLFEQIDPAV